MRNLELVANECMMEVLKCGIKPQKITKWKINTTSVNRWGRCSRRGETYTIEISNRLLREDVPIKSLKQTIIHEILHTCKDCMNHKTTWKQYANIVNQKYGYNISRTNSAESLGISENIANVGYKYSLTCKCCGQVIRRKRKSDFVNNPNNYMCTRCRSNNWELKEL